MINIGMALEGGEALPPLQLSWVVGGDVPLVPPASATYVYDPITSIETEGQALFKKYNNGTCSNYISELCIQ